MFFHSLQQCGIAILNGLFISFPHIEKTVLRKIAINDKQIDFFLVIQVACQNFGNAAFTHATFQ